VYNFVHCTLYYVSNWRDNTKEKKNVKKKMWKERNIMYKK